MFVYLAKFPIPVDTFDIDVGAADTNTLLSRNIDDVDGPDS